MPAYVLRDIAVSIYDRRELREVIAEKAGFDAADITNVEIRRRSLDLRKKAVDIYYVYTVVFYTKRAVNQKHIPKYTEEKKPVIFPRVNTGQRPVIVGAGPAGLFCAYTFLKYGIMPIVLERGQRIARRIEDVAAFEKDRVFAADSNICFGEGGAGTFSDGKLTSRSKDNVRQQFIFDTLVKFGAESSICYDSRPHLGTDGMRRAVENMTDEMMRLGAEFRFATKLEAIDIKDGRLRAAVCKEAEIPAAVIVLACGHSARDTYEMLKRSGCAMQAKPFAVGLRIEHRREDIDRMSYGGHYGKAALPAAEYIMRYQDPSGRGAYTFCNCPGGVVVPCVTEEGTLCVNGMSYAGRDEVNTNSAVVVGVGGADFDLEDPMAGIAYQRRMENRAYLLGGSSYKAPVMPVGAFLNTTDLKGFGEVVPSNTCGVQEADIGSCFDKEITMVLQRALRAFGHRMNGFDSANAMLTAVESRTSSAIRILRNAQNESINVGGLYVAGEGSGYAGGIISSAIDGMKTAEKICEKLKNARE